MFIQRRACEMLTELVRFAKEHHIDTLVTDIEEFKVLEKRLKAWKAKEKARRSNSRRVRKRKERREVKKILVQQHGKFMNGYHK